jgi:hypothetical protein
MLIPLLYHTVHRKIIDFKHLHMNLNEPKRKFFLKCNESNEM